MRSRRTSLADGSRPRGRWQAAGPPWPPPPLPQGPPPPAVGSGHRLPASAGPAEQRRRHAEQDRGSMTFWCGSGSGYADPYL